ncbi:SDR family NAD(P)-dependent oxidoreductase [Hoeflea sp.]|uniref:SDR family NAD(P)-dependent oxidoreductase n=1 Tax=Hoeflea sp. TaxID=1940281 RepID=UPI003B024D73
MTKDLKTASRRQVLTGAAGIGLAAATLSATGARAQEQAGAFAGKTAFITGGARGIGLACAKELARGGANIVLYDIAAQPDEIPYPMATEEDLANAKADVEALGVRCLAIKGDVRDVNALQSAVAQTQSEFGTLDFLIVNAGITQPGRLGGFDEEQVRTITDINLIGSINTMQVGMPVMQAQGDGRIILMASTTGRAGSDNFPLYGATKWAMIGLAKSAALTLAPQNITVNAVCPTLVRTKLLDNDYVLNALAPGQGVTFEQLDALANQQIHPMDIGFYEPVEVGRAVAFLCSDGAQFISGEVVDIGAAANARFPA